MLISARSNTVALLALLLALGLPCVSQTVPSKPEVASSPKAVERVVLTATVINKKGNFVTGLRRDNFQIFIDKEPAEIIDFLEEDVPLSVGILFDASASVGNAFSVKDTRASIKVWQQVLKTFVETGNRSNEYFLLAFNSKPELLMDWTSDSNMLVDSLSVRPHGITALYDACYLAIDKVQRGRYSKRVLILISDGLDTNSTYFLKQVREALRESGVLLYSVNFSGNERAGIPLGMEGQDILRELSSISGGMFFYKKGEVRLKASDAESTLGIIAAELGHQYTIGIKPRISDADSKWHKIKVKVNPPAAAPNEMKGLSVRTREGFYLNHR